MTDALLNATAPHLAASTRDRLRRAASLALDWLMPRVCVLCDATASENRSDGNGSDDGRSDRGRGRRFDAGAMLCDACRRDATASMTDACDRCALPLPQALSPGSAPRVCGRCLRRPPAFDRTCAAAAYTAPFEQLVRGLKYGATLAYAALLADLIDERARAALGGNLRSIDVLIAAPLSRDRMAARGFNQSIEIGRVLARRWQKPLDTCSVLRIVDTLPQAGLRLDARRRNVRNAFAVIDSRRSRLAGRHVAVIDDVMTTGATLDEIARTLKRAGVAHVDNLVVARRR